MGENHEPPLGLCSRDWLCCLLRLHIFADALLGVWEMTCCNGECNQGRDCPEDKPLFELEEILGVMLAVLAAIGFVAVVAVCGFVWGYFHG